MFVYFAGCVKSELKNIKNSDGNGSSGNSEWYKKKWLRTDIETYLDLTGTLPKFCSSNGTSSDDVTVSDYSWNSDYTVGKYKIASLTSTQYQWLIIEYSDNGNTLILSPGDNNGEHPHSPAYYVSTSGWCGGGSSTCPCSYFTVQNGSTPVTFGATQQGMRAYLSFNTSAGCSGTVTYTFSMYSSSYTNNINSSVILDGIRYYGYCSYTVPYPHQTYTITATINKDDGSTCTLSKTVY